MKKYIIGVDIGGTKIATGITDRKGVIQNKVVIPTLVEKGLKVSLQQVFSSIETVINESDVYKKDILGIGIEQLNILLSLQRSELIRGAMKML